VSIQTDISETGEEGLIVVGLADLERADVVKLRELADQLEKTLDLETALGSVRA
jgi:hypothetical protein